MIDSVHAWLDPEQVRRLAASLADHAPADHGPETPSEAGFAADFVGFTPDSAAPCATPTGLQASPIRQVEIPLAERIARIAADLVARSAAEGVFVIDATGEVLFGASAHPEFHFSARAMATEPGASPTRRVQLKVGPVHHLELIPASTRSGRVVLGAVLPGRIPTAEVEALVRHLED